MAKFRFPSIYCCPTPLWYGNPLPNLGRNLGSWGSKKSGFTLKCQIGHNLPLNSAAKRFSGVSGTTQFSFKLSHRQKMTDCLHTHFHLQVSLLCSPPASCLQVVYSSITPSVNCIHSFNHMSTWLLSAVLWPLNNTSVILLVQFDKPKSTRLIHMSARTSHILTKLLNLHDSYYPV